MKKPVITRLLAYLFDMIIITIIVSAISNINFLNPNRDKYEEKYAIYQEQLVRVSNGEVSYSELANNEEIKNLMYDISYLGVNQTTITLVVTFLYFVVFQYFTKGKTAGKLLFRLEVISQDKKDLKFSQLFIRSAIVNSLITTSLLIISILIFSKSNYNNANLIIEFIDLSITITCVVMILYRKDGIGLHDLIAKTIVIKSSEKDSYKVIKKHNNKKVKDADYEVNDEDRDR